MTDLLSIAYPWIKSLHVMAVISWMAGLFYLPRLFVYHAERGLGGQEPTKTLTIMQDKLLVLIMRPAMIATWLAGILLVLTPGIVDWGQIWPWTKGAAVLGMTWFHFWLDRQREALQKGRGLSGRGYRLMNEVPTLLMVVIVLSVIVRF